MIQLEKKIIDFVRNELAHNKDASNDIGHLKRVAEKSKHLYLHEGGDLQVILISSYFHDIVSLPRDSLIKHHSSTFAAQKTIKILRQHFKEVSVNLYGHIADVIRSHSDSAAIQPMSIEAKILRDADRLDAIGAIGLARVFYIAGVLGQKIYDDSDPFAKHRPLDDKKYTLDHFYLKLLKLPETLHTAEGKRLAEKRVQYLLDYLNKLKQEIYIMEE